MISAMIGLGYMFTEVGSNCPDESMGEGESHVTWVTL